jgi:hypothetical protein
MFHSNTELLIGYWRTRKGAGTVPARAAISPADIVAILPQIFILGHTSQGPFTVRLSGGFIVDLHGRELRGEDFVSLWAPAAREALQLALEAAHRHTDPLVIVAEASSASGSSRMELMVAPLRGAGGEVDRLIGLYQPLTPIAALASEPTEPLRLRGVVGASASGKRPTPLRLAAVHGRQIA